jgi:hypothetical protein
MRSVMRVSSVSALVALAASIVTLPGQVSAQRGPRAADAQQAGGGPRGKSSPFVGTWILNVAKSTYEGIPPDQRRNPSTRTIDVQADGTFIQTHRNRTAGRGEGFFHWVGKPGVAEITEFGRTSGDAPGNKLTIKPVSDRQWQVTFRNQKGQILLNDTWTVSPDNKTLTIDRRAAEGPPSRSVEVFDNEGWGMPRAPQ